MEVFADGHNLQSLADHVHLYTPKTLSTSRRVPRVNNLHQLKPNQQDMNLSSTCLLRQSWLAISTKVRDKISKEY